MWSSLRPGRTTQLQAWGLFILLGLVHGLFIGTYPLNNQGGDAANYYRMLVEHRSSLVHAGGYPFLMGLPFRVAPLAALANENPILFDRMLQILQHSISLSASVLLFVYVRRVFGLLPAVVAAAAYGTNQQLLGATSSSYPEWLQASLLVATVTATIAAFVSRDPFWKLLGYGAGVTAFTWCVLVKFNAVVLGIGLIAPLFAESARVRLKLMVLAGAAGLAGLNVATYEVAFHYPSTGTHRLTADSGWVLLTRAEDVLDNRLSPENGPRTRRWLALASGLPVRYDLAGPQMFSHLDAVSPEARVPYRRLFDQVMAVDDAFIQRRLSRHPIPQGFRVGLSVIPVCYYVGLIEGNDLAVAVWREAVAAHPGAFVSKTLQDFRSAISYQARVPLFPLRSNMPIFGFEIDQDLGWGRARLRQPSRPWDAPFAYRDAVVWQPGVTVFERFNAWGIPAVLVTFSIASAVVTAILLTFSGRRFTTQSGVVLTLAFALVLFVLASCFTLQFRWKELCLVMPLVATLGALGLTWAPKEVARLTSLRRA